MMELAAMVDEDIKRRSNFKIIPVFLYSSLKDICDDSPKLGEWQSLWKKWALENPGRVNVEKWVAALKHLRPINGLKGNEYDKLGEVRFQKVIVDAICTAVPPEIKLEVSHIQGRSRICEVIRKKIIEVQQKDKFNGVCMVGLAKHPYVRFCTMISLLSFRQEYAMWNWKGKVTRCCCEKYYRGSPTLILSFSMGGI